MADFVRGDCHKCKYEVSAECVPRSQKMGFPKCYQSTITNADKLRAMTDEELAQYMGDVQTWGGCPNHGARNCTENCADCWLDWLKQEVGE